MAIERKDEILDKALTSDTRVVPRYTLATPEGVLGEHVELRLENSVLQQGMPYDKEFANEVLAASGTTAGSAAALTLTQAGFVLEDGAAVRLRLHTELPAGGQPTLNVNGSGAKPLVDMQGTGLGRLAAGAWLMAIYNEALGKYIAGVALTAGILGNNRILSPDTDPSTWEFVTSTLNGTTYGVGIPSSAMPELGGAVGTLTFSSANYASLTVGRVGTPRRVERIWSGGKWSEWTYISNRSETQAAQATADAALAQASALAAQRTVAYSGTMGSELMEMVGFICAKKNGRFWQFDFTAKIAANNRSTEAQAGLQTSVLAAMAGESLNFGSYISGPLAVYTPEGKYPITTGTGTSSDNNPLGYGGVSYVSDNKAYVCPARVYTYNGTQEGFTNHSSVCDVGSQWMGTIYVPAI